MTDIVEKDPKVKQPDLKPEQVTKVEKPKLYKVILINDDFTPYDFVVTVIKTVFKVSEEKAWQIMMTCHQKGSCVIAVYTLDVAETKVHKAMDMAKAQGHPLSLTTEPEE